MMVITVTPTATATEFTYQVPICVAVRAWT